MHLETAKIVLEHVESLVREMSTQANAVASHGCPHAPDFAAIRDRLDTARAAIADAQSKVDELRNQRPSS